MEFIFMPLMLILAAINFYALYADKSRWWNAVAGGFICGLAFSTLF